MITTFFSQEELSLLGLGRCGRNVLLSRKASIYNPEKIFIGDNVRIDDFCLLSGDVSLGSNIHISAYCALYGRGRIEIGDYSGLSPRCTLLSASDDFSGEYMVSPMAPAQFTNIDCRPIHIGRFCQIGAGSVILPGVVVGEGVAVGAMSFVKHSLGEWTIYAGNPAKAVKARRKRILDHYAEICEIKRLEGS